MFLRVYITLTGEACDLLAQHSNNSLFNHNEAAVKQAQAWQTKMKFWKTLSKSKFALAPPGFGMDTHRAWEILNMHAIPIVISSPLDKLYSQFPVIIVKKWQEVFDTGALERFTLEIASKFDIANPFNVTIAHKLTTTYWLGLVADAAAVAAAAKP